MTPQLKKPKPGDPYYNTKKSGGYSPCILGNNDRGQREPGLNVLPNCVAWCVGRFNEIGQYGYCKWLGSTDAKNFIAMAKRQGLEVQLAPAPGGVMVWSNGREGHVASVEIVRSETNIITSESEWYGKAFALYKRTRGADGNWRQGCNWMGKNYMYLGCIVNPAVEKDMTKTETEELIKSMFPGLFNDNMTRYEADLKTLPADPYAVESLKWAKDLGIMVGDGTGNQMPQSKVKREDLAVVLHSLMTE